MIRVLVVDDSPTVRQVLRRELSRDPEIEVIGVAQDPFDAREQIIQEKPDVITLDIEMPRMDGLTFLRKLMKHYPMPVVVVSTLTAKGSLKAMEALEAGALEVVRKDLVSSSVEMMSELVQKVKAAAGGRVQQITSRTDDSKSLTVLPGVVSTNIDVIAMGSSTGGTVVLEKVLRQLPATTPGIVIVQHMPSPFTAALAERLNRVSELEVREAGNGDQIERGVALVAPGDYHMLVVRRRSGLAVELRTGPRVTRHRPSVDILFHSVAKQVNNRALAVLMTGMGRDGARGLLSIRQAGSRTMAQDEKSCVVFGMPRQAIELGAAESVVPLEQIAHKICSLLEARKVAV